MNTQLRPIGNHWVRSNDGIIAGVCEGVGNAFEMDPWLIRIVWLASIALFGTGLLIYAVLAFTLPRADEENQGYNKRFMGVCHRLSINTGMEIGLVRALTVFLGLGSLGTTFIGYIILHFVIPDSSGNPKGDQVIIK